MANCFTPKQAFSQLIKIPFMEEKDDEPKNLLNWKTPTLGGKQFWTDHHWRRGWRLQQNAVTSHYRLIDPKSVRHAWGSKESCLAKLDELEPASSLDAKRVFVLMHGLMRSSSSMDPVGVALQEAFDCEILKFEYASTRASITDHAAALREVIEGLPNEVQLSFVGHSMGNIVFRHAYGDWQRNNDEPILKRVNAAVMLGPPNQGASIARQLSKVGLFEWITGKGGMELGPKWDEFESKLATPKCPFGIVAGRLPDNLPKNPLVGSEGDFVVAVDEAKLEGAADFLEVPRLHSFLMDDPEVQKAVIAFMQNGKF